MEVGKLVQQPEIIGMDTESRTRSRSRTNILLSKGGVVNILLDV